MNNKPDIFDRFMSLPGICRLYPQYARNKEILLYLFFGGLTTVVSIGCYAFFNIALAMNALIANVFSWILAVLFAFVTNRIWVFNAPTEGILALIRQMGSFFAGRLLTLFIEEGILWLLITEMGLPSLWVKIAAQVIIVILNYVISKVLVFRKEK